MDLSFTERYPYPIDAVWHALTDARAIRQWWVDTDFAPVPGRTFYFQDAPRRGWDGRVTGEVLDARAPELVRFTWCGGGTDTVVEYRLAPTVDGGTDFTLTHQGFRGLGGLLIGTMLRFGWRSYIRRDLPSYAAHIAHAGIDTPFPNPNKADRHMA